MRKTGRGTALAHLSSSSAAGDAVDLRRPYAVVLLACMAAQYKVLMLSESPAYGTDGDRDRGQDNHHGR